jgi:hypothetical protein
MFIKLNIISAFNRLRIKKDDEKFIAFKIRFNLFESLILFFELCNDSVFFQHFINDILREYLNDFCTIYLNDILIYNEIENEHKIHVKRILLKLRETELQADIIKCKFHVTKIMYLELIVIIKRIKMNLVKIDIVINWSISVNMKDVQNFLKFVNFYKRFVYDFSKLVDFSINLIKKNIKFLWNDKYQQTFVILKKTFISDLTLIHFNSERLIIVKTNAFDYIFDDILSQYDDKNVLRLVVYFSKKHNSIECNYEIYDKEFMIIVRCFEEWRSKLKKIAFLISVIFDHKNLKYFILMKQLNRC